MPLLNTARLEAVFFPETPGSLSRPGKAKEKSSKTQSNEEAEQQDISAVDLSHDVVNTF